tara:strand:- start:6 stop:491 length:486 start_codon:yes stop_codon:yes gene_type:complete
MLKLKKLIESINIDEDQFDEESFLESVGNYNQFGKSIYREDSIYDVAKALSEIAKNAGIHAVKETEESFDKITVGRNMKELKSYSDQFNKVASEAHTLQQRMEGLYEDMGKVLNRYYDIHEALDPVGKEDDDVDNDGDVDDADSYLKHKRKVQTKIIKKNG